LTTSTLSRRYTPLQLTVPLQIVSLSDTNDRGYVGDEAQSGVIPKMKAGLTRPEYGK